MSRASRILVSLISIILGGFCSAFLVFILMTDEVGRHQQLIYTLERVLEDKAVQLTKGDLLKTVYDMYPKGEIIVEDNTVYVHRLEFHFVDSVYRHGDIGPYRK